VAEALASRRESVLQQVPQSEVKAGLEKFGHQEVPAVQVSELVFVVQEADQLFGNIFMCKRKQVVDVFLGQGIGEL